MRTIVPFRDYFWVFYHNIPKSVQTKVDYVLQIVMTVDLVPKKFLKHIEQGIYEIRIKSGTNIYRLFCFFEEGQIVILLHEFTKKTQKLPRREINRAIKLRKDYYDNKKSKNH